ncbi:MAG: amidohydrolase family protein [Candidatus Thiodiazotropha sp. (ex Monitilora ramsayi)]|nr:amidohydrolase family protein [Candidatus Thiodiazotropha sp. (ex Monitilora ramsayi)]
MNLSEIPLFDAHFHIIDSRFPLVENQGYLPTAFTCDDYLKRMRGTALKGGIVVSGSFQAFDQSYLLAALKTLGPGYYGVTQLESSVSDDRIRQLDRSGIRGVRFNLFRGNPVNLSELSSFAHRIYERAQWHVELYISMSQIDQLYGWIRELPMVSIDHMGLSNVASERFLDLVESGMRVKASGFGRVQSDPVPMIRRIYAANPNSLMFGSDLPGTRSPRPFTSLDLERIGDALCGNGVRQLLYDNARKFYRLIGADSELEESVQ